MIMYSASNQMGNMFSHQSQINDDGGFSSGANMGM